MMEYKKPVNIFNGLKVSHKVKKSQKALLDPLVAIKSFQNPRNITKPFVKPISKLF